MTTRSYRFDRTEKTKVDHAAAKAIARISATLRARGFGDALAEAAEAHHTTIEETLGRGRAPCAVRARWALWRIMSDAGLSTVEIGRLTERDHTTVMLALRGGKGGAT